jgi:peptidoglycan/xylan/chitin deacetylase (PgdA/CDA1 family)
LADYIEYFKGAGYTFISPEALLENLDPKRRYAMISFDDGYFNNTRVIPLLEKHQVPVTVFVSVSHVLTGKAYWWEALYRFRKNQRREIGAISAEAGELNRQRTEVSERQLLDEFGPDALTPRSDFERPMSVDELRKFAAHPLISIGNHTFNHNVLTAYTAEEVRSSIRQAQEKLLEMIGEAPVSIAYPNGEVTPEICRVASEEGLKLGFSTIPRKEYLPEVLGNERRMLIGRFCPRANADYHAQYRFFRSDLMLTNRLRALKKGEMGGYGG